MQPISEPADGTAAAHGPVPFGTVETPHVAVRGWAALQCDPEIARFTVTVSVRGSDRRAALEDLTRRNTQALELVRGYGEAIERLETGSFTVRPELSDRGRGERVRAYTGGVRTTVVCADFTVLGELLARLADLELASVAGPWWELRPQSPAHAEARRQAVREAVTRAREYASALGADLGHLLELTDPGAEGGVYGAPVPGGTTRAFGGGGQQPAAIDVEPQQQTVSAQVNARFTMTPPRL